MKRVLCINCNMNAGGAETFLMKIYRKLDRSRYQMDFCVNIAEKNFYEDEIMALGGRIFKIPAKSGNLPKYKESLRDVVKNGNYDSVLRITSNAMGFLDLKIAKDAGATRCCARSSNSSDGNGLKQWVAHRLGKILYSKYLDVKFAPSDLAAIYTFGKKSYKTGETKILHNGVDLEFFKYDLEKASEIRSELKIDKDIKIIGHVGRFMPQKNHSFLVDVFNEIHKTDDKTILLLVGNGYLENEIREKISHLNLNDSVIFTGVRSDIPSLMSAMDVFVMPSLFEGMPNTVIEAQAAGLPCVIADTITKEADITGIVSYLPLNDPKMWAKTALGAINTQRTNTRQSFIDKEYDIESVVKNFIKLVFGE